MHISEKRGLLVNVHFIGDYWPINITIYAGIVTIEEKAFEVGSYEGWDEIIYLIVMADWVELVVCGGVKTAIRGVKAYWKYRVGLSIGWPILSTVTSDIPGDI